MKKQLVQRVKSLGGFKKWRKARNFEGSSVAVGEMLRAEERLVKDSAASGSFDGYQFLVEIWRILGGDVRHDVADVRECLQVLAEDIDVGLREDSIDLSQDARLVDVNVEEAVGASLLGEGDVGKVHRADGRALVTVLHQFGGYL